MSTAENEPRLREESTPRVGTLGFVIGWCAAHPAVTLIVAATLAGFGVLSVRAVALDALPDLSDAQVILHTEWPGRSPDLVEEQITFPLSAALLGTPRVKAVRGQSGFGVSFVYVVFEDGADLYWARTRVAEVLAAVRGRLPSDARSVLGPDATGVGWVFQYALVDRTGSADLQMLRSLQDFNLRLALGSVPGVSEVATIGGFLKEYQVALDPNRLRAYGVSIEAVARAVAESNQDVGGHTLELAGHEHMVRGRGRLRGIEDLRLVPVAVGQGAATVLLGELGEITVGPAPRRGFADLNGQGEVVGGIVIMRHGENALSVIDRVKARLREVQATLPVGVEVVVTYDRSDLIRESIRTLRTALIEEMLIVSLVIFLFLLHARSALVPILTLPLAVLLAFIPMALQGTGANIMSLGGIAVAIGAMVDASIILVENVHKRLEEWVARGRPGARHAVVVAAMQEVGGAIFFSLLVMTVSFLPVFTLQGTEGRLFRPLAFTKTYSMAAAAILAVTVSPALAALVVRGRIRPEAASAWNRVLVAGYARIVSWVVDRRKLVLVLALLAMAGTVPIVFRLGSEFMPPLDEGTLLYMPTAPPGMSATEAGNVLQVADRKLRTFPEVASVFGKMGRAETATDPAPLGMAEIVVVLHPRETWRAGLSPEALVEELDQALRFPGMPNIWWMPIQTRTEMLATGVRSPVGIQVFGDSLRAIETASFAIERALTKVAGTRSAFAERSGGGFYVDVDLDREAAARAGVRAAAMGEAVSLAVGGMTVTEIVEGRARYPVTVRYARELRDDPDALAEVLVTGARGEPVPLGQVARIKVSSGPDMIRSEGGHLVGFVFVDTDRPVADYVNEAQRVLAQTVTLPEGVRLAWVGQFQHLARARARLRIIVPFTLIVVTLLLYFNTRSWIETAIVMLAVPFSLIGAIWFLYLLDYNFSVAVWVGLIALAGLDAETGVVMLLYLKLSYHRHGGSTGVRTREQLRAVIIEGAARRLRPKLMTVLTTLVGLLPVLWATGAGADVMKRIAAPLVGGLSTSFVLELTVYPALFALWRDVTVRTGTPGAGDAGQGFSADAEA